MKKKQDTKKPICRKCLEPVDQLYDVDEKVFVLYDLDADTVHKCAEVKR